MIALLFLSCAASIDPGGGDSGVVSQVAAGEAVIDATSETEWTYLDLGGAQVVSPEQPDDSTEWDLGFRRYKVKLNGGVSGTADMAVVPYFETEYATALDPPTQGWVTDVADADGDGDVEYALDTWFDYDTDTHQVSTADVIYVLRDAVGDLAKLQFLAYYDDAGSPGYVHIRWGDLADDSGAGTDTGPDDIEFNCTDDDSSLVSSDLGDGVTLSQFYTGDETTWVCWSFGSGSYVQEGWDFAMRKWDVYTGGSMVLSLPGQDFDALKVAPAEGYLTDPEGLSIFEDWYVYNTDEHTLDPDDIVYVIQTTEGRFFKVEIETYYPAGDKEQPHWPAWKWAEIPASEGARARQATGRVVWSALRSARSPRAGSR